MEQNLNLYHIFIRWPNAGIYPGGTAVFISQPAISKAISRLEQNLNTTLFLRSLQRGQADGNRGNPFRQVESAFDAICQGRNSCERCRSWNGPSFHRRKLNFVQYVPLPISAVLPGKIRISRSPISCQSNYQTMEALEKRKRWI